MKDFKVGSTYRLIAVLIVLALILGVSSEIVLFYVTPPITGFAAGTTTVTVATSTAITLPVSTVAFGTMSSGETNDTKDDAPPPFQVQNDGNVPVNISIRATNLFSSANPNPTAFFRYACGNITTEFNCTPLSQLTYANIPANTSTAALAVFNLTYEDTKDLVEIDINVTIASNETAGAKSSSVSIEAVASGT